MKNFPAPAMPDGRRNCEPAPVLTSLAVVPHQKVSCISHRDEED
jgi:hypothetical protein